MLLMLLNVTGTDGETLFLLQPIEKGKEWMLFVSLSDDFVMTRVSDLWMTRTLNTEHYEIFSSLTAYILILSGYPSSPSWCHVKRKMFVLTGKIFCSFSSPTASAPQVTVCALRGVSGCKTNMSCVSYVLRTSPWSGDTHTRYNLWS